MNYLIALNHPSQYYLFKNLTARLKERKHNVQFIINDKDILEELLKKDNQNYSLLSKKKGNRNGVLSIISNRIFELIKQDLRLLKIVRKTKPDLLIGTDIAITHIGKITRIPSVVFNEDDYNVNKLFCLSAYPFAKYIISPQVCDVGKYGKKKINYAGYQKLAYLHPNWFAPDKSIVEKYINLNQPYYLIRLVSFTAGHDIEKKHGGIDYSILQDIINKLEAHGNVYISSEKELDERFDKYRLRINPLDIHHILYYAALFIGDSQSMCVEASMLGTASIRFNSFVGKISVLEELEQKYHLTHGIVNTNINGVLNKVDEILLLDNCKEIYRNRCSNMLKDKIDFTSFLVWFFDEYPTSVNILKENPEQQLKFK